MDLNLKPEQEMIRGLVRDFAGREVAPTAAERDEKEEFNRQIIDEMGRLGFNGICFPEQYGGSGGDTLSYIIAVEELSRACASVGISLSATVSLCAWPIFAYGSEAQKQQYLVPLLQGKTIGAFGLTEPNAGTDAAGQQTTAVPDGDDYIINGSKMWITNAQEAETYIVMAMTDRSKGTKGISAFIVEKGTPGFTFGPKEHKMGIRSSITAALNFDNVRVPKANLLGSEGAGFKIAMTTLDGGRIGVAAQALGIAQAALDEAVRYSKERRQFGRPIAQFQAISFTIADMATKVEAARMLVYKAAWLKDKRQPYAKEAAMAKLFASDIAMEVTTDAVQIFGGYGYSREYRVERLMRDAKITQIYEGTNQVQRMVIGAAVIK